MKSTEEKKRGEFRSRMGFIIACVGSAVGMGNIWMFPYRVGKFGGFAFLIPYFIFIILLGFSGVIGEMAFGRSVKSGPMGAFGAAMKMRFGKKSEKWGKIIGLIPVLGSLAMAIGYSVVVGWLIKYFWAALSGVLINVEDMGAYFGETAISFGSVPWHMLALGVTFAVMVLGISNGIEKMNKIMMPLFFVFFIILLIRVATLAGAAEGYKYLFVPRWEQLGNIQTWVYALGQAFFSLSVAGSGTIVYGSYLKKDVDVVSCAKNVALFDTIAALISGMVVIPAVFAFGLDVGSGPPLMFITLPAVFQNMPVGSVFAVLFFIAAIFAAITSLVNLTLDRVFRGKRVRHFKGQGCCGRCRRCRCGRPVYRKRRCRWSVDGRRVHIRRSSRSRSGGDNVFLDMPEGIRQKADRAWQGKAPRKMAGACDKICVLRHNHRCLRSGNTVRRNRMIRA